MDEKCLALLLLNSLLHKTSENEVFNGCLADDYKIRKRTTTGNLLYRQSLFSFTNKSEILFPKVFCESNVAYH